MTGLWMAIAGSSAHAEVTRIERLVMPGELLQGHAKFENECEKCHELFSKKTQSSLCLDCHKKIAADIRGQTGFHGKQRAIREGECRRCHTDHKGRKADIVQFDTTTFDHAMTDYSLNGAHREVKCEGCHVAGKKYREAPSQCFDCHGKKDPHQGRLGRKCQDCHSVQGWSKTRFDHDKTHFPLTDKHKDVACASCHPGTRFKDTPLNCHDCHQLNDVHGGRYGSKCQTCHSARGWDKLKFDHDRDTHYRLAGRHRQVGCDSCHKGRLYEDKLKTDCYSCHRQDDDHHGVNGQKCESCHNVGGWSKIKFDHDKDTKYPLRGKHRTVACESCHKEPAAGDRTAKPAKLATDCYSCHKNNDQHRGRFGVKCDSCHTVDGWQASLLKFDHDRDTRFVLKGSHAKVACESCHKGKLKEEKLGKTCVDCHRADDVHKGQEGERCERCHNETKWSQKIRFDHDLVGFPLIGMHAATACEQCHLDKTYKDTKTECVACHRQDDVHKARLGTDCAQCHNPNSWRLWQFDHNTRTKYVLDGKHVGLKCEACHTEPLSAKVKLPTDCAGCHRDDDVHQGNFGRNCERCHVTRSFNDVDRVR